MNYFPSLALGLLIGTVLAVGCVDDDRPLVSLPVGGELGSGGEPLAAAGEPATTGGSSTGGSSTQGGVGSEPEGGAPTGTGGAPSDGGTASGEAGAPSAAGAGGESSAEAAPFAGPYGAVYVGPVIGVDTRFPDVVTWSGGSLVHFLSENDEEHAIGTAMNLDTGKDAGVVQWGRCASAS